MGQCDTIKRAGPDWRSCWAGTRNIERSLRMPESARRTEREKNVRRMNSQERESEMQDQKLTIKRDNVDLIPHQILASDPQPRLVRPAMPVTLVSRIQLGLPRSRRMTCSIREIGKMMIRKSNLFNPGRA